MIKEEHEIRIGRMKDFYTKCGEILGCGHDFHTPFRKKTRWNVRVLGNGRYPGYGVIRWFSPTMIHAMINRKVKTFVTEEDVYQFLEDEK